MAGKNSKRLAERPKPPTCDEIISDIEKAPYDDVVFSSIESVSTTPSDSDTVSDNDVSDKMPSASSQESFMDLSVNVTDSSPNDSSQFLPKTDTKVQQNYNKVLKFIRMNETLQKTPKLIQTEYMSLKNLGEEVASSIAELRAAAIKVLKTSGDS